MAALSGEQLEELSRPLLQRLRTAVDPPDVASTDTGGLRPASVLLLFDPASPQLPLLFMLRSSELRHHAGQIAFPGGGHESGDDGVVSTALREAQEEFGLDPENVEVIGVLPPFATAVSDRWLTPVVGLQRAAWTVRPDPLEVAEWFLIELTVLLEAPHQVRRLERDGVEREVHFYTIGERVIWGVTGAILHELIRRLGRRG